MLALIDTVTSICQSAFGQLGLSEVLGRAQRSAKPEMADFQCNGAMAAAKAAKRPPRDIAADVVAILEKNPLFASVEIAGPGFINMRVSDSALAERASMIAAHDMCGARKADNVGNVIIDFGGPNVAKPMHVGHLRSAVIGDTLQRILRFAGDKVVGDVHLGDWGLQMGHLVTELHDEQPDLSYFDADFTGPYSVESPVSIEDLARLYPQASIKAKADPERNARSQQAVAELQAGRPGYRALLRHFIDVSVAALKQDYAFLNVSFDLWKGESDVDHLIAGLVEEFAKAGLSREDAGAIIVDVSRDGDTKDMPPLMLVNSRGGTGYHTTDLATIKDRLSQPDFKPDTMLYVVDQRQALHFEQVFRAADALGMLSEKQYEHIGFGTVNGKDGKPFKTREGGVLRLADLNQMAIDEAEKKLSAANLPADMGDEERAEVARKVARAALRFADLQNTRTTNYIFDLERFTSFEGKTGPYMLYAAVRVKSLLRRAEKEGLALGPIRIHSIQERQLVLTLDGFSDAVLGARAKRMPHILCEHLFAVAQAFSAFYGAHPIAAEKDAALRGSRLSLSAAVLKQLVTGLDLLGIDIPERM